MWQCASMIFFGCVVTVRSFRRRLRACAMRASHSSCVSNVWAGISGGLSSSHDAVARVELDDLELARRRRAVERQARHDACSARPLRDVHLEPLRAERGHVVEQHDPLGPVAARLLEALARDLLAVLARDLAVAMAERRVAHRLAIHEPSHRRRGREIDLARELAALVPRRDEVVLAAHVAELARRPRCTTATYSWYSVALTITEG